MKLARTSLLVLTFVVAVAFSGSAFADEGVVAALKNQVDSLTKTVDNLTSKLSDVEKRQSSSGAPVTYVAPQGGTQESGLVRAAQNIDMGGHLDIQWNKNFREPAIDATNSDNTNRVFDNDVDSFVVNAANIYFQNRAQEVGEAGFRALFAFGEDAGTQAADGRSGDNVDLQEAFVEYIASLAILGDSEILPDSVTLKAGRFPTLAGVEVTNGSQNWNISRGLLYGFAVPTNHTGVRSNFKVWKDFFDVYFGANNGWDNAVDNNSFKTLEHGIGYSPIDGVSVMHVIYWGGDTTNTGARKKFLWSNVIGWDVTEKLQVKAEFDLAQQHNVVASGATGQWWGIAGFIRYALTNKLAVAYRSEFFADERVIRGQSSSRNMNQTLTGEYKLTDQLLARAEFRYDNANGNAIYTGNSGQTTIAGQLIYVI